MPLRGREILDWLPITIPADATGRNYAFEPKQVRDLLQTAESFEHDKHWQNPRQQIAQMNELCEQAGAKFLLVLAPTKARVVLPLVANRLNAAKVRAFAAIDYKKPLTSESEFLEELLSSADSKEKVIADWCNSESIPFFSPAPVLRHAMAQGIQVYYSYDQHWTPEGHEHVARAIQEFVGQKFRLGAEGISKR